MGRRTPWGDVQTGGLDEEPQELATVLSPEIYDVLFYDTESDLISIHADATWLRDLYRSYIGAYAFGDPNYFPPGEWLILDPLFRDGPACCNCEDVDGLEKVKLVEVQRHWFNQLHEIDLKKADDVFAAFADRWRPFMRAGRLTKAIFKLGWRARKSMPPSGRNIASYDQHTDSAPIEQWLIKRGFVKAPSRRGRPGRCGGSGRRLGWSAAALRPATTGPDLLQDEWPTVVPLLRSTGTVASRDRLPEPGW